MNILTTYNMNKHILIKEINDIVKSRKFILIYILSSFLILLTFYFGAENYKIRQSISDTAISENNKMFLEVTDWSNAPYYRIFLYPSPLSSFVNGITNDLESIVFIKSNSELISNDSQYGEHPIYAIFRFLDLEFLFNYILSLFAILLCYNSISGEKERGTLRLLFSHPISRITFVTSKLCGSFIAIGVPLIISFSVGALLIPILGVTMLTDDWILLTFIIILGLFYVFLFMLVSILISSVTKKSTFSLIYLLLVWITFTIVIPNIGLHTANTIVNVPSINEIDTNKAIHNSQLENDKWEKIIKFQYSENSSKNEIMKEFSNFLLKLDKDKENQLNDLNRRLNENRINRQNKQVQIATNLSRLSPSASFTFAIRALAGTDIQLNERFYNQANLYKELYSTFINDKINNISIENNSTNINIEIPHFSFINNTPNDALIHSFLDINILLLYFLLSYICLIYAFRRYDLR